MASPGIPSVSLKSLDHGDLDLGAGAFDGWQMEYVQMSPGVFAAATRELQLPGLQVFLEHTSVRTHQFGRARTGSLVFGIPLRMPEPGHFNGRGWQGEVCLFRGEQELDAVVPAMQLLVVAVEAGLLREHLWLSEGVETGHDLLRFSVQHAEPRQAARLGQCLQGALQQCLGDPGLLEAETAQADLRAQVLDVLLPVLMQSLDLRRPPLGEFSRLQLVRRARERVLDQVDAPLQILDICRDLRVSRRALQQAFQDVLGINPLAWLRLLRLSGARKDLQHGDPATLQVADVLARWGFWHASRFSGDYRQMFGELPSHTLRGQSGPRACAAGVHS